MGKGLVLQVRLTLRVVPALLAITPLMPALKLAILLIRVLALKMAIPMGVPALQMALVLWLPAQRVAVQSTAALPVAAIKSIQYPDGSESPIGRHSGEAIP
jgi:hypothetical protein